jgi:IS30 family transposase
MLKIPDRTKSSVVNALNRLERLLGTDKFNDIFTYIIFDNGVEFRDVNGIENSNLIMNIKRTKVYFARPYCSTDRAINENNNRMIRKFFGKKTNFNLVSDKQI